MLYTLAVCALLIISVSARTEEEFQALFSNFVREYSKEYATHEFFGRYNVFKNNVNQIDWMNEQNNTFTVAINKFADLSQEEFSALYLGLNEHSRSYARSQNTAPPTGIRQASSLDWVEKGAVTPIKNQGQCGSCWAFSTTGSLEGAWFLAKGSLESFSEQQLVDCAGDFGNLGCRGGLMDSAFEYIIQKGITTEDNYPYTARDGICKTPKPVGSISKYVDVVEGDEEDLMNAVQNGPVSVAIEADHLSFQFYSGGVYSGWCGKQLDHGVLLVGYGTDGSDYWRVKNSWGESWGENGFIRMVRDQNQCGIALAASYPIV